VERMKKKFVFLEHTADIKFQAFGKSLNELFENSALALVNSMHSGKIEPKLKRKIKVKGRDLENLLYSFLEGILFLLDSENFFPSKLKVKIDEKTLKLEAEIFGDEAKNYPISLDVKAITYNQMFVKKANGIYISQVVVDA
jgi:SHS2 domain-containing protein